MKTQARFIGACVTTCTIVLPLAIANAVAADGNGPNLFGFVNPTGIARTYTVDGAIDFDNPFFQSLGTNGRSCGSCHQPADGWTIVPAHVQARFETTDGEDPLFRTNDGSNSPATDVSTVEARRSAYSMLLTKGLIRVGIGVPPTAEFELVGVDDPYGYASDAELSLFRRPLPATNLRFLATVMWDGRETFPGESIHFDLSDQANGATLGHAAGTSALTAAQRDAIVRFESGLFTAQATDNAAGVLGAQRGSGGPVELSQRPRRRGAVRHVHDVPQHPECRQSLDVAVTRPRPDLRGDADARYAALYATAQTDGRHRPDHRSRAGVDHGKVERHVALQGTDPAGVGGARAVFSQWLCGDACRRRRVLQRAVHHRPERAGEGGSRRVPSRAIKTTMRARAAILGTTNPFCSHMAIRGATPPARSRHSAGIVTSTTQAVHTSEFRCHRRSDSIAGSIVAGERRGRHVGEGIRRSEWRLERSN